MRLLSSGALAADDAADLRRCECGPAIEHARDARLQPDGVEHSLPTLPAEGLAARELGDDLETIAVVHPID
jgi:hypothetical protein